MQETASVEINVLKYSSCFLNAMKSNFKYLQSRQYHNFQLI